MSLLISCPGCGTGGRVPDHVPGGMLGCPRCGVRFPLPGAAVESPTPAEEPGVQAAESVSAPAEPLSTQGVWIGASTSGDTPLPTRNLVAIPHAIQPPPGAERVPVGLTPDDASAQLDWLRHEIDRFNFYVAKQMASIQRSREELAQTSARAEAEFVTREQDFNRRQAAVLARADALARQREEELARQRAEVERRVAEVERMEAAVRRRMAEAEQIEEELRADMQEQERELILRSRAVEEAARPAPAALPLREEPPDTVDFTYWG